MDAKKHRPPLLLPSQKGSSSSSPYARTWQDAQQTLTPGNVTAAAAAGADVRLVDAGAAGPVAAAAPGAGAVADPRGADEHGAAAAALPPPPPLPVAAGEDDEGHDGQAEDDRAVERLPAQPALRHAQELRAHLFSLDGVVSCWNGGSVDWPAPLFL
jgi:hypothetical protein